MSSAEIMVGLSGGVDSAVTAYLLQRSGRRVATMFMKNWEEDDAGGTCPAEADAADARRVAEHLGLPFYARNFAVEYWDGVFAHFLAELERGRTPNPDILCNREVKFKTFVEHAADLGVPRIATGHYARLRDVAGKRQLLKAHDGNKDQSYFLHLLDQTQLAVAEFPLGDLDKPSVRALALEANIPVHAKRDSTGICFIGERNYRPFVSRFLAAKPGPMQTVSGQTVGEHQGLHFYTLGQRDGLGIGGRRGGSGEPWFVLYKDIARNVLVVNQGEHPQMWSTELRTEAAHWIAGSPPGTRFSAMVKTRYRQADQAAVIEVADDASLRVQCAQPQRAVTPGQSLVIYQSEVCLGGAVIADTDALVALASASS